METEMEKTFWESVREIAEAQRKIPEKIRALADVPNRPFRVELLFSRRAGTSSPPEEDV